MLSNRRKEHRRSKARAKASYNSVLVEGNIDDWFRYLSNYLFCLGCLAVVICMDEYIRKIITASRNHLKPIQGGTIRKVHPYEASPIPTDHLMIGFQLSLGTCLSNKPHSHFVYDYSKADFEGMTNYILNSDILMCSKNS